MATSDPAAQADRVATFRARADRICELRDELDPLIADRIADMWEMKEWGWTNERIAEACRVSEQYVGQIFKRK